MTLVSYVSSMGVQLELDCSALRKPTVAILGWEIHGWCSECFLSGPGPGLCPLTPTASLLRFRTAHLSKRKCSLTGSLIKCHFGFFVSVHVSHCLGLSTFFRDLPGNIAFDFFCTSLFRIFL